MRAAVPAALLLATSLVAQTPQSSVTLPLDQYDALRASGDVPSATVIDTIALTGSFGEKSLGVAFLGRTTGKRPAVKAIDGTNDVTIAGCKGNAILTRSARGAFDLVPLAETFELRCDLRISGSDRLQMHVAPSVLAVRASVADGELVAGDEDDQGGRAYVLVRHVAGPSENLAATATGRYLVTILPDATRFRYSIDVHNPNRTTSNLDVTLQSNEHLQRIDSAAPYEVKGTQYSFSIPPGDSSIVMTGELRGTSFAAPVKASLQYLVVESHPLLRAVPQTSAKRISLGETGLTPQYRGALAFETGAESIRWQVTRLQALHTISYAVTNATHIVFIPVDGPVLGQSNFQVRNEGAAELTLPKEPEPTYVSLQDEPLLMTRNAAGRVSIPLSPGEQQAMIQHRQDIRRALGFAFGRIAVPQLEVTATNTNVNVRYPREWVPLVTSFSRRIQFWNPGAGAVVLALLLALWCERLLAWLGVERRRFAIAFAIALAASLATSLLWLTIAAASVLTLLWLAIAIRRYTWTPGRIALAAIGAVVIGFVIVGTVGLFTVSRSYDYGGYESAQSVVTSTDVAARDGKVKPSEAPGSPAYQGLPAKFDMPGGARTDHFHEELLPPDRPHTVLVIAISSMAGKILALLFALLALTLLWPYRARLVQSVRDRLAELQPVAAAPVPS